MGYKSGNSSTGAVIQVLRPPKREVVCTCSVRSRSVMISVGVGIGVGAMVTVGSGSKIDLPATLQNVEGGCTRCRRLIQDPV